MDADLDVATGTRGLHATPASATGGAALLALIASEEARGIRGLDVLRRSVDRAPPQRS